MQTDDVTKIKDYITTLFYVLFITNYLKIMLVCHYILKTRLSAPLSNL